MNDQRIQFHIIVPVYNCAAELEMCLASLRRQSYKHFTVYLADDASDDGSTDVIRRYREKDERFVFFNRDGIPETQEGPLFWRDSVTRFLRQTASPDDYFWFVDADDTVAPDALEILCRTARATDSDCIAFGCDDGNGAAEDLCRTETDPAKIYHTVFVERKYSLACVKIFKVRTIRDFDFSPYFDMRMCEDGLHNAVLFDRCTSFTEIGDKLYRYRFRASSLSHLPDSLKKRADRVRSLSFIGRFIKEKQIWDDDRFRDFYTGTIRQIRGQMVLCAADADCRRQLPEALRRLTDPQFIDDAAKYISLPLCIRAAANGQYRKAAFFVVIRQWVHSHKIRAYRFLRNMRKSVKNAKGKFADRLAPLRRDIAAAKDTGCQPLFYCTVHFAAYVRRKFCSKSLSFTDADGNAVTPRHVFVHSLVLDGTKAFTDRPDPMHDFEKWFVTREEFFVFLRQAYQSGYVLVKVRDLLAGKVHLPKGKTPLVLSADDMNYYEYMKGCGFAERTEVDENGRLRYPVQIENGTEYCPDGDLPGALEQFIAAHPDFSFNGARAVIGVTGYEGLLGYRDETEAAPVVTALKEKGYEFACHSWGHHHRIYYGNRGIADTQKWLDGVGRAVGKTDLFISPFGTDVRVNSVLLRFLKKKGFRYFFSVAYTPETVREGNCFFMTRFDLDGLTLRTQHTLYAELFGDPAEVYDRHRKLPMTAPRDAASFVLYAEQCLDKKTVYLWGAMGETVSEGLLKMLRNYFGDHYTDEQWAGFRKYIDGQTVAFDCAGLIKRFLMGGYDHFRYNKEIDRNAKELLEQSCRSGDIATLPEVPGVCLYMKGHTGIYIGGGRVIEATGSEVFGNGVVQTALDDRPWEKWYYCNGIEYGE